VTVDLHRRTVGVPAIRAALREAGVRASRMLVEQELAVLKRADRAEAARDVLDHGRRRATLGWRTAAEVGATVPRADALVDPAAFHAAACTAMQDAGRGPTTTRAVQRARRDACFATLVAFGVATRHVGPRPRTRPGPTPCSASRTEVECAGERP
jgi:hypothetical protein